MVQGSEFRIHGFRIQSAGVENLGVVGSGFRVQGSEFRVQDAGFPDLDGDFFDCVSRFQRALSKPRLLRS